jgi:flavin reductase (DIM6/NTAB) family NADH-FMN oxidoreductase RutF
MGKIEVGAKNFMYPTPTTLVGANVAGKPNYITIAHVGILHYITISVSMHKGHYTNGGVKENGTFSVNIPSTKMVKVTDYCGMVSGKEIDKAALFTNFYGKLKTAPMIEECPANMECRLIQTVELPTHEIFIGEIVATYCAEEYLTQGKNVDLPKVDPILFSMSGARYFQLGREFARAWQVGRELVKQEVGVLSAPPLAQD